MCCNTTAGGRVAAMILSLGLLNGCATMVLPGQGLSPDAAFVYGTFRMVGSTGECAIILTGDGFRDVMVQGKRPMTGFSARAFILPVPPGTYRMKGFRFATNTGAEEVPWEAPGGAGFLSTPFAVGQGEGVYLGDYKCEMEPVPGSFAFTGTGHRVTIQFKARLVAYEMEAGTGEIVDVFGPKMNGRRFRSLNPQQ